MFARLAALTALMLAVPLGASASGLPDPLEPNPLDPVIAVLPARPVPFHANTSTVCPDGASSCIDLTIAEMQRRFDRLAATCDHDAVFSLAYLRVTQDVRSALGVGWFADQVWLRQIDALFAQRYFDTMDRYHRGEAVPAAWKVALDAARDHTVTGLGDFMLNMNAHINRDFSYTLNDVGLTARDGSTHKPDHNAYNTRLDRLYVPVFAEEAARFDPTFDDLDVGPADEDAAKTIMRGWREMVWRNAEDLALTRTPWERTLAEQKIEHYALMQANMIKVMFASPDKGLARDAYCRSRS